ncbi:putative metal-dependent HD superfamily phosphohydrolase [Maribacter caenipelagi]|uniref:Putative metal-dependent HD superfamily phosphohydrolase n=1 Tax=Maribacter caenipelagi TaxID=1447781 RepID=A0A4V6Q038_9FLAO|nr:Pycsar system effector family protein [Maribacter caenipelagi]TDS18538.1 putative metal-dependent HD superfamily phosphohydrolase [Maribacter caenipelagi]
MSKIVSKAEVFATNLLSDNDNPRYLYHNLRHTQRVVNSTKELIEGEKVNEIESEILLVAAWFHDLGYTISYENHEENSCQMAKDFLAEHDNNDSFMDTVCSLIMATKKDYEPKNELEKIIRDADSSHFHVKNFVATTELLREEISLNGKKNYSSAEWREGNIALLRSKHRFYTDYAISNWQKGKDKNIKKLIKAKKKHSELIKKESLKAKFKGELPDRGIQTLYRVTLQNHLKLSDIADTKANILLSVNAIIISMALANLVPKLDNPSNDYLFYPTFTFIIFSVVSMVMSILATKPNITSGQFTEEEVTTKKVNLLFFGNFHKMKLEQYSWAMSELIKDKDYIYSSLTKDLYFLGIVLERKYRILRWTYTVFMVGIIISVIVFGIALKFYGPERVLELPVMQP